MTITSGERLEESWNYFAGAWQDFAENLKGLKLPDNSRFDLDKGEQQDAITYELINVKVLQCKDYVETIYNSVNFSSIPVRALKRVRSMIEESRTQLQDGNAKFSDALEAGGFAKIDYEQFVVATTDDVLKLDVGSIFRNVFERLDIIAYEYSVVSHFLKVEGASGFYFRKAEVDRIVSQVDREAHSVSRLREDLSTTKAIQTELVEQLRNDVDEIDASKDSVTKSAAEVDAALTELAEKTATTDARVAEASAVIEKANALQAKIDGHEEFIEENRAELVQLKEDIDQHRRELILVEEKIQENDATIKTKIEDAENMLEGATIAGLAGQFGKIKEELDGKLEDAKNAVHLSAWFLLFSVSPILLYVFGPALHINTNGVQFGEGDLTQSLTGLAMRSVLLIPATWFARFSARRYDRVFRLKEHYAYKLSLATAVEGFKKQAPAYEDDIAAETFYELTFNPADKLDYTRAPVKRRESLVRKAVHKKLQPVKSVESE